MNACVEKMLSNYHYPELVINLSSKSMGGVSDSLLKQNHQTFFSSENESSICKRRDFNECIEKILLPKWAFF